jgi:hypothetical protein
VPRQKRRKAGAPQKSAQPRPDIDKRQRLLLPRGQWLACAFRRFASLLLPGASLLASWLARLGRKGVARMGQLARVSRTRCSA